MKIALAAVPFTNDIEKMLGIIRESIEKAANAGAQVICFPECCIPGMRGIGIDIPEVSGEILESALDMVCGFARTYEVNTILPMEYFKDGKRLNVACFIDNCGNVVGMQTKNQLDPAEDGIYFPGESRQLFEIDGVKLGIVICHEGFRYPESVRWAAKRGAKIVFQPYCAGSDTQGRKLTKWCASENPYYEKAQLCRTMENNIFFAAVNFAFKYQDGATAVISPEGELLAALGYGVHDVLICDIDPDKASGLLAMRCKNELYSE